MNKVMRDVTYDYLNNFPLYKYIGTIGSYGNVTFTVAENNVLTPEKYEVQIANRVNKHDRINAVDISEFKKRELKKITIPLKLVYSLCNIKKAIKNLTKAVEKGEHYPLIIGGQQLGEHNFCITNFNYSVTQSDGIGTPLVAICNLNLEEYIERIDRIGNIGVIEQKNTSTLDKKVIKKINTAIISELNGGRLW